MSAILAVCGTAFCAMVSDGRMVEEPITDGKIKVLTDALPKVRKLNRNVLVGFAGDAVAAAQIINKLDEYDVQYMTLEKAVKVIVLRIAAWPMPSATARRFRSSRLRSRRRLRRKPLPRRRGPGPANRAAESLTP